MATAILITNVCFQESVSKRISDVCFQELVSKRINQAATPNTSVRINRASLSDEKMFFRINPVYFNFEETMCFRISRSTLAENDVLNLRIAPVDMKSPQPIYHEHDWDIIIEKKSLLGFSNGVSVTYDENAHHNEIVINMISELYWDTTLPVEVDLITNGVSEKWVIEEKTGTPDSFQWLGRSLSAYYSEEYTEVETDMSGMASEIAESVIPGIDWQAHDWHYAEFQYTGSPINTVAEVASVVKALVRCDVDGRVIVRPRKPIRPIDLKNYQPEIFIDAGNMKTPAMSTERTEKINGITVQGPASEASMENIQIIQEEYPYAGEDVIIQVFFGSPKPENIDYNMTAGELYYDGIRELEVSDTIHFENGIGQTEKPVLSLTSYAYQGNNIGNISFTPHSKILTSEIEDLAVVDVSYVSEYHQYIVQNVSDDIYEVIGKLLIYLEDTAGVTVVIGDGDNIAAEAITENYITDFSVATARATAELDERGYDFNVISLVSLSEVMIFDGNIVLIDNPNKQISGNFHIQRATRLYEKSKILCQIEGVNI